jgi:hypothetical protein
MLPHARQIAPKRYIKKSCTMQCDDSRELGCQQVPMSTRVGSAAHFAHLSGIRPCCNISLELQGSRAVKGRTMRFARAFEHLTSLWGRIRL